MSSTTSAIVREPWNRGKLVGQKSSVRLRDIWAVRIGLQLQNRSTVRHLGVEVDDALEMAEKTKA